MRGAERTFAAICDLWPQAPIATLLYDEKVFGKRLASHPIQTSALQRLGATQRSFKALLPFMPLAAERLDVAGREVIISSSSAFAHGVRPDEGAAHICYCHAPFRYAWHEHDAGLAQAPRASRPLVAIALHAIRAWDRRAASRGAYYIANSRVTQDRMSRYWNVNAPVVHPPVELSRFKPGTPEDFALVVGELVAHKKVEIALEAARRARVPIKVVGGGTDMRRLAATYNRDAEFLGRITDDELARLYSRAKVLVVPTAEEFGIAAVEAQAAGRPVVAARAGGALETVLDGVTGAFFEPDNVDDLAAILGDPGLERLRPSDSIINASRFSVTAFQAKIQTHVRCAISSLLPSVSGTDSDFYGHVSV